MLSYLGAFQPLEPILNLCRDDTGEPTRRIGPSGGDSASVGKPSGGELKKVISKKLTTVLGKSVPHAHQLLGQLTGLIVAKSRRAYDTRTMVGIANSLHLKTIDLQDLKNTRL